MHIEKNENIKNVVGGKKSVTGDIWLYQVLKHY